MLGKAAETDYIFYFSQSVCVVLVILTYYTIILTYYTRI